MLTILQAIKLSSEYLAKKGIEDPRINAEVLLCSILSFRKINLYLSFDRPLSEEETNKYRELVKRRADREPLQYITGKVEFYGLNLKINRSALIPRPETELLVERVIDEAKQGNKNILDIGTGSGNIAVAVAANVPDAFVTAIDKSEEAVKLASENSGLNSCKNIQFEIIDIFTDDYRKLKKKFDVVVSNPPYVSEKDYINLEPELRVYEPEMALTDKADGLMFYKRILELTPELLNRGGKLFFEMGEGQSVKIRDLFDAMGFSDINITKDYQGINRIISGEMK